MEGKSGKIAAGPRPGSYIHRLLNPHMGRAGCYQSTWRSYQEGEKRHTQGLIRDLCKSTAAGTCYRPIDKYVKGHIACETASQKCIQTSEVQGLVGVRVGGGRSDTGRPRVVVKCLDHLERNSCLQQGNRLPDEHRRIQNRLGCGSERSVSQRLLGQRHGEHVIKLSGNTGSISSNMQFPQGVDGQACTGAIGQCFNGSISKPHGGSQQGPHRDCLRHLGLGSGSQHTYLSTLLGRSFERHSGQNVALEPSARVAVTSGPVSNAGEYMGPSYSRQVCIRDKLSASPLQFEVHGPVRGGGGRLCSAELGGGEQLCKRPIQTNTGCSTDHQNTASGCYNNSSNVAGAALVPGSDRTISVQPVKATKKSQDIHSSRPSAGTVSEHAMEYLRLEDLWDENLLSKGWSERAAKQVSLARAKSTRKVYNYYVNRLLKFCLERSVEFPPCEPVIADFMCLLTDQCTRPNSVLKNASAGITQLYHALDLPSPVKSEKVHDLKTSLVKTQTQVPASGVKVMPIRPFHQLFLGWPSNGQLTIKQLRLKCITLLALAFMTRPSDLAPRSVQFDPVTMETQNFVLSTDQVVFLPDGSIEFTFFGIKNDTDRSGFKVVLPPTELENLDPGRALQCYIQCTDGFRDKDKKPLFIALNRPHKALSASAISKVLDEAILCAGLGGMGFSAKSFRPTAATAAMDIGVQPETAMQIGRWKTKEVFFNHYVYPRAPASYTNDMFNHD